MKKILLGLFVFSLAVCALIGIFTFLFASFNHFSTSVLMTTLTIAYFSAVAACCFAARDANRVPRIALAGIIASAVGFLVVLVVIWTDWYEHENWLRTTFIAIVVSFTLGHVCALSLARLSGRAEKVFRVTAGIVLATGAYLTIMIIFNFFDAELSFRILGVLAILDGCGSIAVPVLARMQKSSAPEQESSEYTEIKITCPRCGSEAGYPIGKITCTSCSLKLEVYVRE